MIEIGKNYKIKEHVTHQGIGGKEITIERLVTMDEVDVKAWNGNPACFNFIKRREDSMMLPYNTILGYGHVNGLGYIVCEDELYE